MRNEPREFAYIVVFGTIWGLVEIGLGSLLHTLNVPLKGSILTALTAGVALTGRTFVPTRGSLLQMGLIAAFLKIFSFGGSIALPLLGIMEEALILEGTLIVGGLTLPAYIAAGGLAVLWTPVHFLFVNGILITGKFHLYYDLLLGLLSGVTGLGREKAGLLFLLLALFLFLIGALVGALAWHLGCDIRRSALP